MESSIISSAEKPQEWKSFLDSWEEIGRNLAGLSLLNWEILGSSLLCTKLLVPQLRFYIGPFVKNILNCRFRDLGGNALSGSIPPELGNLTSLNSLCCYLMEIVEWRHHRYSISMPCSFLDGNGLDGTIPPQLGKLMNLTSMYIVDWYLIRFGDTGDIDNFCRSLNVNLLSGNIPPEFGDLSALTSL